MSAILNTVYNHYLTSYAPKSTTQFDSHKKSELRSVYHSIVKLNKESPWYLPIRSITTQKYAVDLKENARQFYNNLAALGALDESGLSNKKTAYSTDTEIASANFIGNYQEENISPTFTLEVQSLASPQENLGRFLSNHTINLTPDTYSFNIGVNNMNYEFRFIVDEDETNLEVQERLVQLINNANIGVKASLVESDNKTALKLTSESTGLPWGKSLLFTVSDDSTGKTAGTVNYLGLDYLSHPPTNAHFTINGEANTASSNHFTVGKMFELELNGISPEGQSVTVGLKTDTESLTDNINSLVNGYNKFIQTAASYEDNQSKSRRLINEVTQITSYYKNSLESIGLNPDESDFLAVNPSIMEHAVDTSDDLTQTFGFLKDFTRDLLRKSNEISIDPMNYVNKIIVAYKNPTHNFPNPYQTSAYSGMMFNGYC